MYSYLSFHNSSQLYITEQIEKMFGQSENECDTVKKAI
jgi:hypothetical protein